MQKNDLATSIGMSMASQGTQGLLGLSDEVLVLVLSFLRSDGDLLNCSRVSHRFRKLSSDKSLVRRLSFRRDVLLNKDNFKFFFSIPSTCAKVLSLNLNGVHWIAASAIQAQIVKMRNLEELHVGDILFSPRQFSSLVSRLTKLKKLSLTWHWVEVAEVEEVTKPELVSVYSQLQHLNLFLGTGDRCPLDKLTWLLALCRDLTHLSLLSQTVHSQVRSSLNRFNIVISTREFDLPALVTVLWDVRNDSYPPLLVSEVRQRLENCLRLPSSQFITNKTKLFSKGSQRGLEQVKVLEPGDCQQGRLCWSDSHQNPPVEVNRNLTELRTVSCPFVHPDVNSFENLEKLYCIDLDYQVKEPDSKSLKRMKLHIENMTRLKHLEIKRTDYLVKVDSIPILDAFVSTASQLETLILWDVKLPSSQNKVISNLLKSCPNLRHLQLSNIRCPAQSLFADLQRALKEAKALRTLKILQKQLTQFSPRLLGSLSENCDQIEHVVLVDTSRAFTLNNYPKETVIKLSQKKSVKFVYIGSDLLTLQDVKYIKKHVKSVLEEKPFLLVRLQSRLNSMPFYGMDDIGDLPMELQTSVASLAVDVTSSHSPSSVASLSLSDIF